MTTHESLKHARKSAASKLKTLKELADREEAKSACQHEDFTANVAVGRLSQVAGGAVTHYVAEVEVKCSQCGTPFHFLGVPVGYSPYRPTSDFSGRKLNVPLTPPGVMPPDNLPGFALMQPKEAQ